MLKNIKKILVATCAMLALDFIYIMSNKKKMEFQISDVQRVIMQFKPLGAVICYFFLVFGLYYFILKNDKPVMDAFLLGLVIYAVYDSTNYATFKKWAPSFALMDTLWGGTLFALTTYITYTFV